MADIMIEGSDQDFIADLQNQIMQFIPKTQFVSESPDLIIIDEDFARYTQLREKYRTVPIILLTSNGETKEDTLDICLKKPLRLMIFLDTVKAANHKLDCSIKGYLQFNDYELRPRNKEIVDLRNGNIVKLTEREVEIIKYLHKNIASYMSKSDLQTNVWQYNEEVTTHTVETHIYRLRQKVETNGRQLILTDNGCYKLVTDDTEDV